jgi:excisionase family DNA binding protein
MYEPGVTNADRPLVLSVGDAARLLGISRAHAYQLVARGELPHIRLGRRVVVPRRAIDLLIDDVCRNDATGG